MKMNLENEEINENEKSIMTFFFLKQQYWGELTDVYVSILIETVNDEGEDESNITGIVVCQVYDPSTWHNSGCVKHNIHINHHPW